MYYVPIHPDVVIYFYPHSVFCFCGIPRGIHRDNISKSSIRISSVFKFLTHSRIGYQEASYTYKLENSSLVGIYWGVWKCMTFAENIMYKPIAIYTKSWYFKMINRIIQIILAAISWWTKIKIILYQVIKITHYFSIIIP